MNHDIYRPDRRDPGRERSRDRADERARYIAETRRGGRGNFWPPPRAIPEREGGGRSDDQRHPYEWYRSRSHSRSPPRRPRSRSRSRSPRPRDPSPRRNGDVYRFGAGDDRMNGANGHGGRDDFTFRSNEQREFRGGAPPPRGPAPREPRNFQKRGDNRRHRGGSYHPRRFGPPRPSDRKILQTGEDREGTPERLEGMIEGASKFKDINDLFVSDDESGSESAMDLETPDKEENGEPAAKRAKVTKKEAPAPEPEKPKWSNPDPYYLIPPLDESRAKRKDVVQLLRKAKVEAQNTAPAANAVSRNADFIGFGDDDDDEERDDAPAELMVNGGDPSEEGEIGSDEEMEGSRDQGAQRPASLTNGESSRHVQNSFTPINNSSAGPSFSHLRNLHSMEEPQTNGTSLTTTQVQTPVEAPAPSEQALNEARELLAEMNAKEGIEPQNSKRHDRFDRRKPHTDRKRNANEGEITKMWTARDRKSSTPWYIDHSESPNTVYWLHQEICDFYEFIKPQEYEARIREDLMERLQRAFSKTFAGSRLYAFGSFAQGIYLPTSDMDLVLFSPGFQRSGIVGFNHRKALYRMQRELVNSGIIKHAQDATVIVHAKVPIIKFVDEATGLNCDISLDNDSGIKALTTFEKWKRTWPFLPKLMSVLKQWLLMRNINEVFNGGLGGFSLTCMLVSMLQQRVDGQTQNLDSSAYLGELLLDFFDLYGNKFNMNRVGIDMPRTELFRKNDRSMGKAERWTIIDPNNPDNDLSVGSSQARLIQKKFSESHADLVRLMKTLDTAGFVLRKGQSFLRLIIGGNYEKVILQRNVMRGVHQTTLDPI